MNIERHTRPAEYIAAYMSRQEAEALFYKLESVNRDNGGEMNETLQEMWRQLSKVLNKACTIS